MVRARQSFNFSLVALVRDILTSITRAHTSYVCVIHLLGYIYMHTHTHKSQELYVGIKHFFYIFMNGGLIMCNINLKWHKYWFVDAGKYMCTNVGFILLCACVVQYSSVQLGTFLPSYGLTTIFVPGQFYVNNNEIKSIKSKMVSDWKLIEIIIIIGFRFAIVIEIKPW